MPDSPEPPEFLTTRELAALLRVRERKVYELAAEGQIPCRRVTGKLLFPRREVDAWLNADAGRQLPVEQGATPPMVISGSHDPLLDWAIRASGSGLASFFDGSIDGLDRVKEGRAAAAALHIRGESAGTDNVAKVEATLSGQPYVLLGLARRQQGLILGKAVEDAADLGALAGRRLMTRQPQAGAHLHLAALLGQSGFTFDSFHCLDEPARTEGEAAAAVASGHADWAFGLETVAREHRLAFRPMVRENFDLLIHRKTYFEPAFQSLVAFIASPAFAEKAAQLGGYEVSNRLGVRWNG